MVAQDAGPARLRRSRLHLVTDRQSFFRNDPAGLVPAVAAAVRGGVDVVHLREHDLTTRELYELALALKEAIGGDAALVVNDRLDIALAAGADGVQLGGGSLPVGVAKSAGGRPIATGKSVHGLEEAVQAERDGADYLILGTIYPSRSHPGFEGSGPALVREVTGRVAIPVFAIGGVEMANLPEVIAAGAQGVAVISAILGDSDPEAAARRLRIVLDRSLQHAAIRH